MKKTFEITFTSNPESGIYSANLILAESAEQATAYFATLGKYEIVGCTETASRPKPGQPIHEVPEGWEAPEKEEEKCGYKTSGHHSKHSKHSDFYSVEKEVA